MDRRFFSKLLLGLPFVRLANNSEAIAFKLPNNGYAPEQLSKNIIMEQGGWTLLSDKISENSGYKLHFEPWSAQTDDYFNDPDFKQDDEVWVVTYPNGEEYRYHVGRIFSEDEVGQEQNDLLESLKDEKIIHQLHLIKGKKHRLLVVYKSGKYTVSKFMKNYANFKFEE